MASAWISPNGSDVTGDGSEDAPFASPAAALATLSDGDTLYAVEGFYKHALDLSTKAVNVTCPSGRAIFDGTENITGTWRDDGAGVFSIAEAVDPGALVLVRNGQWSKPRRMDSLAELTAVNTWWYTGGRIHINSGTSPATAYDSIRRVGLGGIAGLYASTGGIYVGSGVDNVTLTRIGAWGWRYSGLLADDNTGLTQVECDFAFNGEDGTGGFGLVNFSLVDSDCHDNGTRIPRAEGELNTDGDGASLHDSPVVGASTNFFILRCRFYRNTKDGVQNIENSTGIVAFCLFVDNTIGVVVNAVGTQAVTGNKFVMGATSLAAVAVFSFTGSPTAILAGNSVYGANVATIPAFRTINGTVTSVGNAVDNCDRYFTNTAAVIVSDYNMVDVGTLGVTLGAHDVQDDPEFVDPTGEFYVLSSSPVVGAGTSLAAFGGTYDYYGIVRPNPPAIGACEPRPRLSNWSGGFGPSGFWSDE